MQQLHMPWVSWNGKVECGWNEHALDKKTTSRTIRSELFLERSNYSTGSAVLCVSQSTRQDFL